MGRSRSVTISGVEDAFPRAAELLSICHQSRRAEPVRIGLGDDGKSTVRMGRGPFKKAVKDAYGFERIISHKTTSISREHVEFCFRFDSKAWELRDLFSTNGVFVNYVRLDKGVMTRLKHGDRVDLGDPSVPCGASASFIFLYGNKSPRHAEPKLATHRQVKRVEASLKRLELIIGVPSPLHDSSIDSDGLYIDSAANDLSVPAGRAFSSEADFVMHSDDTNDMALAEIKPVIRAAGSCNAKGSVEKEKSKVMQEDMEAEKAEKEEEKDDGMQEDMGESNESYAEEKNEDDEDQDDDEEQEQQEFENEANEGGDKKKSGEASMEKADSMAAEFSLAGKQEEEIEKEEEEVEEEEDDDDGDEAEEEDEYGEEEGEEEEEDDGEGKDQRKEEDEEEGKDQEEKSDGGNTKVPVATPPASLAVCVAPHSPRIKSKDLQVPLSDFTGAFSPQSSEKPQSSKELFQFTDSPNRAAKRSIGEMEESKEEDDESLDEDEASLTSSPPKRIAREPSTESTSMIGVSEKVVLAAKVQLTTDAVPCDTNANEIALQNSETAETTADHLKASESARTKLLAFVRSFTTSPKPQAAA
ncbi:Type VI secretion system FHA domain protein [Hondaea fermentalgiana]|uniref:Type VI secretion system FHA domain protein n=1 Tax=Hondaea fermentalgiana TaxID=2315210 RepID=A0A2R5GHG8_9STRA|nr:Type VI secretion system FHA domain protein [Hondaea fermentalgiana]|eukprot:GBG30330.1 Type VI secretion system FHA domain protein [Hondaea fermentalgiana]